MALAKRTLLIDADIVAFKFAAAAVHKTPFGTYTDDLEEVTPKVDEYLQMLKDLLEATDLIICLSCPSDECFRRDILPTYKGNRDESSRPPLLQEVKDYMEHAYPSYRRPRLEADDVMGILSTHPVIVPGERIIVSEDKDMQTIPGLLFNPNKDTIRPRRITPEYADYYHLYQTIIGDATDNYKGCPGAGPVAADKALLGMTLEDLPLPEMWAGVVRTFESAAYKGTSLNLTEADALVQARVARICRASDYDFQNKKAIPWQPPKLPRKKTTASTAHIAGGTSVAKASNATTQRGRKTAA